MASTFNRAGFLGPRNGLIQHQRRAPTEHIHDRRARRFAREIAARLSASRTSSQPGCRWLRRTTCRSTDARSGGQIRFSQSCSNRYSARLVLFCASDKLQAHTWARNRSPNAIENTAVRAVQYTTIRYSSADRCRATRFKTACFLRAHEWFNYRSSLPTRPPSPHGERRGELQRTAQSREPFFGPRDESQPADGQRFQQRSFRRPSVAERGWSRPVNAVSPAPPGFSAGNATRACNARTADQRRTTSGSCTAEQRQPYSRFRTRITTGSAIYAFRPSPGSVCTTDWERGRTRHT